MDNNNFAKIILETYSEIIIDDTKTNDEVIFFSLMDKNFALVCPGIDNSDSVAMIFVMDDAFDYPHIMLKEFDFKGSSILPAGKYRYVCLHQAGSVVSFLQSSEEKICDEIERLIELMQLSPKEVEREYQKEFLYYWNSVSTNDNGHLFVRRTTKYERLTVYEGEKKRRYVSADIVLSDIDDRKNKSKDKVWQCRIDIEAFFVPIIDNRGIIPPTKNRKWGAADVIEILYGKRIRHISSDTFDSIKNEITHYNCVDLIFSMVVNNMPIAFMVRLIMKNCTGSKTLLARILDGNFEVQAMSVQRQDYCYLNEVIGNSSYNYNKKVLLIGAGSLGSYVASELVKNGFRYLTIYDGDYICPENFMRWAYGGILKYKNKAGALKFYLEWMHPEIIIEACEKNFDIDAITDEINDYDYIIFTVGSSDVQLKLNRILKGKKCTSKVMFAWLEVGGDYSHILYTDYNYDGCFECLFTDENGNLINNKANILEEDVVDRNTINNGCGATRVAYGSAVLLRTVSALLTLIGKLENEDIKRNCLVNITPEKVDYVIDTFKEKWCRCCGYKTQ